MTIQSHVCGVTTHPCLSSAAADRLSSHLSSLAYFKDKTCSSRDVTHAFRLPRSIKANLKTYGGSIEINDLFQKLPAKRVYKAPPQYLSFRLLSFEEKF